LPAAIDLNESFLSFVRRGAIEKGISGWEKSKAHFYRIGPNKRKGGKRWAIIIAGKNFPSRPPTI
jgi:hypothetical protein